MGLIHTSQELEVKLRNWEQEKATADLDRTAFEWRTAALLSDIRVSRAWTFLGMRSFATLAIRKMRLRQTVAKEMADTYDALMQTDVKMDQLSDISWEKIRIIIPILRNEPSEKWLELARLLSVTELTLAVDRQNAEDADQSFRHHSSGGNATWVRPLPRCGFFVRQSDWHQLCFSLWHQQNALLLGHSGAGKTELCSLLAEEFGRQVFKINFGATSEPRSALIGSVHLNREQGTWFAESRFLRAIQTPGMVIIMDELSRCRREAFNIILPLLDGQKYIAVDENPNMSLVYVAEGVTFLATANQGVEYTGAETLDQAVKDRFHVILDLDFPPASEEVRILAVRTGIQKHHAETLVRIAQDQRGLAGDGAFVSPVSTRTLLAAATQIAHGIGMKEALRYCVASRFSQDGAGASERSQFDVLVQKHLGTT
ncbi:MAG: AAA family ATPase [Planctomycetota bacterium]